MDQTPLPHPRFLIEPLLLSPALSQSPMNPKADEVFKANLWEACDLLTLADELIEATQESDATLVIPWSGPASESH